MATRVVNLGSYKGPAVYCGRGSPFGNPYVIGQDGTRAEVILAFGVYFEQRLVRDPEWAKLVEGLKDKVLACHCDPLPCHVHVIRDWLDG